MEHLTEKERLLERLLEHSEKLLVTAERSRLEEEEENSAEKMNTASSSGTATATATITAASADPPLGSGINAGVSAEEQGLAKGEGVLHEEKAGQQEGARDRRSREELLAATEAVWRISEMAREVLEGEIDRRGEAVANAKKTTKEANEALFNQVEHDIRVTEN